MTESPLPSALIQLRARLEPLQQSAPERLRAAGLDTLVPLLDGAIATVPALRAIADDMALIARVMRHLEVLVDREEATLPAGPLRDLFEAPCRRMRLRSRQLAELL